MPRMLSSTTHGALRGRVALFAGALLLCILALGVPSAFAETFNPNHVISDYRLRAYKSMSEADIQAFLDSQPGVLKSLVTKDYAGSSKRASRIIYEACQNWHISPKVMLTMLQKEQSLLTRTTVPAITLERAIGAGCPNDTDNRYPGFGPQIWNGARMLDGYGEGKTTAYVPLWAPGTTCSGGPEGTVTPANIATYKLYIYNPRIGAKPPYGDLSSQADSLRGNASFWNVYRRYFGDPLAKAPAPKPKPEPKPAPKKAVKRAEPKLVRKPSPVVLSQRICRYDGTYFVVTRTTASRQPVYRYYEPPAEVGVLARWARPMLRTTRATR